MISRSSRRASSVTPPVASPVEHHALNALFEGLGEAVSPNSCDLVVLSGRLDHARLTRAIHATLQGHPILAGSPLDLRFVSLRDDDATRVDAHLLRQIWDEPLTAPLRFVVTETPSRTYFQTLHTHVYADATACYTLTAQIAEAYARHPAPPVESTTTTTRELLPPSRAARALLQLRGLVQSLRDLGTADGGLASRPGPRRGRRVLSRIVLTQAETAQLRQAARQQDATLHGFFQLAFLRAATAHNRRHGQLRPTLRLWDFFSMRPLLEAGRASYDCLALIYPIDLDARCSDGDVLKQTRRSVQRLRKGELLVHAARFHSLLRLVPRRQLMRLWPWLFKSNLFLTNPGVCPSTLRSFGRVPVLDYVTFPQLFVPADLLLVFSTFRDRLRILVVRDEDAFDAHFEDDLLAPFLDKLGELGGIDLGAHRPLPGFMASWLPMQKLPLPKSRAALQRSA